MKNILLLCSVMLLVSSCSMGAKKSTPPASTKDEKTTVTESETPEVTPVPSEKPKKDNINTSGHKSDMQATVDVE